jgi:hypothetical protein
METIKIVDADADAVVALGGPRRAAARRNILECVRRLKALGSQQLRLEHHPNGVPRLIAYDPAVEEQARSYGL